MQVKELYEAFDRLISSVDKADRVKAGKDIMRSQAENLWIIGTVANAAHPVLIKNNLRNVPKEYRWGCDYHFWRNAYAPQWFFEK